MQRILAVSLGVAMAASAWAQHGGSAGHGAGAGHAGGGFSSGRSFSAPAQMPSGGSSRSFAGSPAYRTNSLPQRPSPQYNSPTGPAPFGGTYPYGERSRGRERGDGHRAPYSRAVYLVPGWLNSGFYGAGYGYGYSDDSSNQQQSSSALASDQNAYGSPDAGSQPVYEQPPARPPYQSDGTGGSNAASQDIQDQPQVTLLFKDGRPPQQVQNYAVTRTTLYVLDGAKRREIPLSLLDLSQTEKTNRDAGVEFSIPTTVN